MLVLGVLPGLILTAGLSLVIVIKRLSRPTVGALGRDPETGSWGLLDRHPSWKPEPGFLVARVEGPLFYANVVAVKDGGLSGSADLDVETLDALAELVKELHRNGVELRLAEVRAPALELLARTGLAGGLETAPTLAAALHRSPVHCSPVEEGRVPGRHVPVPVTATALQQKRNSSVTTAGARAPGSRPPSRKSAWPPVAGGHVRAGLAPVSDTGLSGRAQRAA